jgi:acetylornithine deacetylase/succinyl-diaminopimelate desuccinylase-like protein
LEAAAVAVRQGPWGAVAEDAVVSALRFEGDVLVQTHDAFTVAYARTGLEVHGQEGSIVAVDVMTADPGGRVTLRDRSGEREIQVEMDARLVPGAAPDELLRELREVAGPDVELAVDRFDPGPSTVDMSAFEVFAGVLREADPEGAPVPMVLGGVTDGRFFARLGIQTYGFLPMRFPPDLDFSPLIHAADERVPVGEVGWGAERIGEAIARYRG